MKTINSIQAYAMTLIGGMFIAYGSGYFQPKDEYRVPRILLPVLEIFGNVGLAIGLILLGLGLILFALKKLKDQKSKPIFLIVFAILTVIAGKILIAKTNEGQRATLASIQEKIAAQNTSSSPSKAASNTKNAELDFNRPQFSSIETMNLADELEQSIVATRAARDQKNKPAFEAQVKRTKELFSKMRKHSVPRDETGMKSIYIAQLNAKFYSIKWED